MNKNVQTYYAIVSVEEGLPDSEEYMFTIVNGHKNHDYKPFDTGTTHWLSKQQGVVLSVEEWEKIKIKDDIIRSLEQQIQQANEKLDQIGAPSISAYGNQLTIFGRLDGCVYVEPKTQLNTKP